MKAKLNGPDLPHGYICHDCANRLGGRWPKYHVATCHYDVCKYCDEPNKNLASISDYDWPHVDLSGGRD